MKTFVEILNEIAKETADSICKTDYKEIADYINKNSKAHLLVKEDEIKNEDFHESIVCTFNIGRQFEKECMLRMSGRDSGKKYKEKLMEEFQRGRECERRSIVARLKNKFETDEEDEYHINYIYPKGNSYETMTLEDICNFILEGDK